MFCVCKIYFSWTKMTPHTHTQRNLCCYPILFIMKVCLSFLLTCLQRDILCHMCLPCRLQEWLRGCSHPQPRPSGPLRWLSSSLCGSGQTPHSVCQRWKWLCIEREQNIVRAFVLKRYNSSRWVTWSKIQPPPPLNLRQASIYNQDLDWLDGTF